MATEDIENMLNRRSGVFGRRSQRLPGTAQAHRNGDAAARLAYDVYIHRLRKYIGAYLAVLGNTDVISFTAGVGRTTRWCDAMR